MKFSTMLFFTAIIATVFSFSQASAQKKISVTNGDTLIVTGIAPNNVSPVKKSFPKADTKKKTTGSKPTTPTVRKNDAPISSPTVITSPAPWGYPVWNTKDQFSQTMIILLSLFGLFALGGLILGIIAVSDRRIPLQSPVNHFTVHGGTAYGGYATANPDLSKDYHGDHSYREDNSFFVSERKGEKEEKATENGAVKETVVKETVTNN